MSNPASAAQEYQRIRQSLGTQQDVADRLGVARGTIARRETGVIPVNTEALLALKALISQPRRSSVREMYFASGDGVPMPGHYSIFIDHTDTIQKTIVVASGLCLLASDKGRDAFLNRIMSTDLAGVRADFVRFIITPTHEDRPVPKLFEFEILADIADFKKRHGLASRFKTIYSAALTGGAALFLTDIDRKKILSEDVAADILNRAGFTS